MNRWDEIRCVVFDFDGTLVDSNAIKRDAYFEVVDDVPESRSVVERVLVAHPDADRFGVLAAVHQALGSRPGLRSLGELVDGYSRICEERVVACPAMPGAIEALEALAPRHALYLDSATPTEALVRIVALRGWQDHFRGVLGSPTSKHENLARIAGREGLTPTQVVYVGDGRVDRDAAATFGCQFLGYRTIARDLKESEGLSALAPLVAAIYRDD